MKSEYIWIIREYFDSFSNQNIEELRGLYSEDVVLKDWEISVEGKENVLKYRHPCGGGTSINKQKLGEALPIKESLRAKKPKHL